MNILFLLFISYVNSFLYNSFKRKNISFFSKKTFLHDKADERIRIVAQRMANVIKHRLNHVFQLAPESIISSSQQIDELLMRGVEVQDVEVSDDRMHAKVWISLMGSESDRRTGFAWIARHVKKIRWQLARQLRHCKHIPFITLKPCVQMEELGNVFLSPRQKFQVGDIHDLKNMIKNISIKEPINNKNSEFPFFINNIVGPKIFFLTKCETSERYRGKLLKRPINEIKKIFLTPTRFLVPPRFLVPSS
eukprot:GHVL01040001.1.p1 GENE.GHVL01040001.1~~GHVL01040001.1.p1  ORF type:complete len:249 (-),score=48.46 GHVL01040001.1:2019-2765(-)